MVLPEQDSSIEQTEPSKMGRGVTRSKVIWLILAFDNQENLQRLLKITIHMLTTLSRCL